MSEERQIRWLTDLCLYHRYLYYVLDNPEISDPSYDSLERFLTRLEETCPEFRLENSPTQCVGSSIASSYPEHIRKAAEQRRPPREEDY